MKEKLTLDLNNKDYDSLYQDIVGKFIELAKEIASLKKLSFPNEEGEKILYKIDNLFEENFHMFEIVSMLSFQLTLWNDESRFNETKEDKLNNYINLYNSSIDLLEEYKSISNEINTRGYKELVKERINKLETLFKEMLDYKNKEYNDTDSFNTLIPKISQYYHYFNDYLLETESALYNHYIRYDVESDFIDLDDVEVIHQLDDLFEELTEYKHFADFYRDFELEEGQTFKDLYELELIKFINLFKEMLEYRNISYEGEAFDYLRVKVVEAYPCYYEKIHSMNIGNTYIMKLNALENVYEYLSNRYKNYEEDMKNYKEEDIEFIDEE